MYELAYLPIYLSTIIIMREFRNVKRFVPAYLRSDLESRSPAALSQGCDASFSSSLQTDASHITGRTDWYLAEAPPGLRWKLEYLLSEEKSLLPANARRVILAIVAHGRGWGVGVYVVRDNGSAGNRLVLCST